MVIASSPSARSRWLGALTRGSALKVGVLALATVALLVQHWMHPAEHTELHNLHRHLLFIPVILMAFWYGWRGGLVTAVAVSLAYFPHLLQHWMHTDLTTNINRTLELLTYLAVGGVTGWLVDRLRGEEASLIRANEALASTNQQLAAANAELAARGEQLQGALADLTTRTREVFEAEQQLRRADRLAALGQLTSGLAHEIRNPLASIRGAAEILGDPAAPDEARREFSRILVEETVRLDQVLGNFLDYARTQRAGGGEASNLARVIEKIGALLGRPLQDARVTFETRLPPDLPPLVIPENLLQQALLNLLLNAIQAMAASADDPARPRRLTVEATVEASARVATLTVSDTGPGIAPANAERIFDPFFTTKPQGVGLGLSIVHQIVTGQGGRISLDPACNTGARFVMTLPLA